MCQTQNRPMGRFWYTHYSRSAACESLVPRPARAWWVKDTALYWSTFSYYLFRLALRKKRDLSSARLVERGLVVERYELSLDELDGKIGVSQILTDKLFVMIGNRVKHFYTLWFKNNNGRLEIEIWKVWIIVHHTPRWWQTVLKRFILASGVNAPLLCYTETAAPAPFT